MGKISVVGIGPGSLDDMTYRARRTIEEATTVVGYKRYVELIAELVAGKTVLDTGMTQEIDRCRAALKAASEGETVVVISSGDAGIYGMALGQAVDCYFENQKLGLEELKFLHIHKTARLIAASLQAGCVVAGLDETEAARIYDIGLDLGLAFQIADDIIDATQSAETAGKPTHNDGAKNSFTNLLGVDGAVQAKNELIAKIERELGTVHTGIRAIVTGLIDKHLR